MRMRVYKRSCGRCYYCGTHLGSGWQADHKLAYSRGGTTRLKNLVAACEPCNMAKFTADARQFKRRITRRDGLEWRDAEAAKHRRTARVVTVRPKRRQSLRECLRPVLQIPLAPGLGVPSSAPVVRRTGPGGRSRGLPNGLIPALILAVLGCWLLRISTAALRAGWLGWCVALLSLCCAVWVLAGALGAALLWVVFQLGKALVGALEARARGGEVDVRVTGTGVTDGGPEANSSTQPACKTVSSVPAENKRARAKLGGFRWPLLTLRQKVNRISAAGAWTGLDEQQVALLLQLRPFAMSDLGHVGHLLTFRDGRCKLSVVFDANHRFVRVQSFVAHGF
jgi:hypothetical protein